VFLPRQSAKLARGGHDKEHAMSQHSLWRSLRDDPLGPWPLVARLPAYEWLHAQETVGINVRNPLTICLAHLQVL